MTLRDKYFKLQLMFLDGTSGIEIYDDYLWRDYRKTYYSDYDTVESLLKDLDERMDVD